MPDYFINFDTCCLKIYKDQIRDNNKINIIIHLYLRSVDKQKLSHLTFNRLYLHPLYVQLYLFSGCESFIEILFMETDFLAQGVTSSL